MRAGRNHFSFETTPAGFLLPTVFPWFEKPEAQPAGQQRNARERKKEIKIKNQGKTDKDGHAPVRV